jgi:hypothetical protein
MIAVPMSMLAAGCPVARKATNETSTASATDSGAIAKVIKNDA